MNGNAKELEEISYKLFENWELVKILNLVIWHNMQDNEQLSVINLSKIIEKNLKCLDSELVNILDNMGK